MSDLILNNFEWIFFSLSFFITGMISFSIFLAAYRSGRKSIKVLKKGNKKLAWSFIKCKHCNSELEFLPEHVHREKKTLDSFGETEESVFIICPVCGQRVYIQSWKVYK